MIKYKSILHQLLSVGVNRAGVFFFLAFASNVLSKTDYSKYVLLIAYSATLYGLALAGPGSLLRTDATLVNTDCEYVRVIRNKNILTFMFGVIVCTAWLIGFITGRIELEVYSVLLLLSGLVSIFIGLEQQLIVGFGLPSHMALVNSVSGMYFFLLLAFVFYSHSSHSIEWFSLIFFVGNLVGYLLIVVRRIKLIKKTRLKSELGVKFDIKINNLIPVIVYSLSGMPLYMYIQGRAIEGGADVVALLGTSIQLGNVVQVFIAQLLGLYFVRIATTLSCPGRSNLEAIDNLKSIFFEYWRVSIFLYCASLIFFPLLSFIFSSNVGLNFVDFFVVQVAIFISSCTWIIIEVWMAQGRYWLVANYSLFAVMFSIAIFESLSFVFGFGNVCFLFSLSVAVPRLIMLFFQFEHLKLQYK